ncbi:hypothetical protein HanHA300_Chr02g0062951 [Helianthus annuus]|nr:hypothetical protein HanHA300_Chr02g0062951 [Helianthus annuus]
MGVVRTYESRRFEIEEFRWMIAGDLRSKSFAGDPVPPEILFRLVLEVTTEDDINHRRRRCLAVVVLEVVAV